MAYQPITPLPDDHEVLAVVELRGLERVWHDRHANLEGEQLAGFLTRLKRDWAIETGIVERLYDWERGVTEMLIAQGISASLIAHGSGLDRRQAEHASLLIEDHLRIVDWLFEVVKGEQPISEHLIRSLHQMFARHQDHSEAVTAAGQRVLVPLLKGEYKTQPNNPRRADGEMHEYCPPEFVRDEMQRLVAWHGAHDDVAPEVSAAWLHHRFTQIHPFQDGNGRVARALASLVFLRAGLFPLVVRKNDGEYIADLECADDGDLGPLIEFFARRQKESILAALEAEPEPRPTRAIRDIITSAVGSLATRLEREAAEVEQIRSMARGLEAITATELATVEALLNEQLRSVRDNWSAAVETSSESPAPRDYQEEVAKFAVRLGYHPTFERCNSWVMLQIKAEAEFCVLVHFHGYGHAAPVAAAVALVFELIWHDYPGYVPTNVRQVGSFFQFNYAESTEVVEQRFHDWLNTVIPVALEAWRRSL